MKSFFRIGAPIFWALLILVLCSIPGKDIPSVGWLQILNPDKWVHATIFAVQYLLLMFAFSHNYVDKLGHFAGHWWAVTLSLLYAALTEVYQHVFLPDRYGDVYDFIANAVGVLLGVWLYYRYGERILRYVSQQKTL
jgi:glycopeptide antibiotics resistance protein